MSKTSDFTDRFVSAYNKYIYVASASIFICVLNLSGTNSFFGIKVTQVNERWVETVFFLSTLALGWNYLLRVLDERKVIKTLETEARRSRSNLKQAIAEFNDAISEASERISEFEKTLTKYTSDKNVDAVTSLEAGKGPDSVKKEYDMRDNATEIGYFLQELPRELKNAIGSFEHLKKTIETESKNLRSIPEKFSSPKISTMWLKIRFWSVDLILPSFLLFFLFCSYLYPNSINPFLAWIGELTDMSATHKNTI